MPVIVGVVALIAVLVTLAATQTVYRRCGGPSATSGGRGHLKWPRMPPERRARAWRAMSLSLAACISARVRADPPTPGRSHRGLGHLGGGGVMMCCCLPVSPPKPSWMFAGRGSAELRRLRSAACLDLPRSSVANAAAECSFHENGAVSVGFAGARETTAFG
jgi:hypothetical protein